MKRETDNPNRHAVPAVAALSLAAAVLACGSLPPPEPIPTMFRSTAAPSAEGPTAPPTEPTATPSPAVCPAPGSPTLARPTHNADYATAIQRYLSAGGDVVTLESTLASWSALPDAPEQVVVADLTGDGVPEVIAALRYIGDGVFPSGDLLILACEAGGYILQYQEGYEPQGMAVRLLQVSDANLDGRADVVYTLSTCGAHTCYEGLEVRSWSGTSFVSLMGGALEMPYPTYSVTSGRIDAQSGRIGSVGAEPQRGYSEVWEWSGSVFTVTQQIWEPPVYRYHALLDGDRALLQGDHATARATYERVISDEALQEWGVESGMTDPAEERARLIAFARWRLVLTCLLMGDSSGARAEYDCLQAGYPPGAAGHDVASLAEAFWPAYQAAGRLTDGCRQVVATAGTHASVLDFFNTSYGYANPLWEPTDLCPFTE